MSCCYPTNYWRHLRQSHHPHQSYRSLRDTRCRRLGQVQAMCAAWSGIATRDTASGSQDSAQVRARGWVLAQKKT